MPNRALPGAQKRLEGDRAKGKHVPGTAGGINPHEPIVKAPLPEPPRYIKGDARDLYEQIRRDLGPAGIVTLADRAVVESACFAYQQMRLRHCEAMDDPTNMSAAREFRGQSANLLAHLKTLGLTPVDRQRVMAVGTDEPDNPFDEYKG